MKEATPRPQIDSAKLGVGGGIAGAIFTIGSVLIFLFGIPVLRYLFPAAIVLGCIVALVLRFIRHDTPGKSWLLPAMEQKAQVLSEPERKTKEDGSARILLGSPAPVISATR
jgi:sugar phosphate permease